MFLFSYFSAVRLVDTPHGLCLSLFAKVTITATLVPFTDHGLDATNVGWPYDGLTPSRAPLHSLAFAEESCGEQVDCAHCAVRATHERREQRECRSFKNVHDEEPGERYERGQVSPANEPRTYSYVAELVVWARWLLQCFRSNTGRARALREAAGTVRSAHLAVCTDDSQ